jgi:uncharacterized protein
VRIGLQPVDGPLDGGRLGALVDQLGSEDMLMFATDYPHAHTDEGLAALPKGLPDALREKILSSNAREHFRLP